MTDRTQPSHVPTSVSEAVTLMRVEGYVTLEGVLEPSFILAARETFLERYSRFLGGEEHVDALTVGRHRYMITLQIEAPFDDERLLANSRVMPIIKALLGDDCVMGSYGIVCSLPGASAQGMHSDGGDLFPETPLDDLLPAASVTMAIPLRELNASHGTTALWPRSHRRLAQDPTGPAHEPVVHEGDALLWDYRLRHAGTPNRSALARPLLYATYCRQWFYDSRNFVKQAPLAITEAAYRALPEESRRLLSRAAPRTHDAGV